MEGKVFIAVEGTNPVVYAHVGDFVDTCPPAESVEIPFEVEFSANLPVPSLPRWLEKFLTGWARQVVEEHNDFHRAMHRRAGRPHRPSPLNKMRGSYWRNKWALRSGRERGHWRWFKKG